MKIAIYIPNINPEAGGASSLVKTIQSEIIKDNDNKNEYIFLYKGDAFGSLITRNGKFNYLNINYFAKFSVIRRIKNKISKIFLKKDNYKSLFDIVAKEMQIDLFWFTTPDYYDISYPFIYTVWDLGHRRTPYFPEVSRSGWTNIERENTYKKMLYRASYILTGNEEGKKEILENFPMPENKIRISPFPVASFCYGNEIKPNFDIPNEYFFYPAQFWPHKNHICILESLVYLREKYNLKPTVFFTGSDKGNKKYILSKIDEYKLNEQVIITGFLKDEELKYLYTHATGMIFASLMGPNNMPPIEGTFLNCPVIITDLNGHKEQLQDTALYFNGYNYAQLAIHMKNLLLDKEIRSELKNKEKILAKKFASINYFSNVKSIIKEFELIRHTWGIDFIHL